MAPDERAGLGCLVENRNWARLRAEAEPRRSIVDQQRVGGASVDIVLGDEHREDLVVREVDGVKVGRGRRDRVVSGSGGRRGPSGRVADRRGGDPDDQDERHGGGTKSDRKSRSSNHHAPDVDAASHGT